VLRLLLTGYQEAITYSFVDADIQKAVAPDIQMLSDKNSDFFGITVMRTTLCVVYKGALYNTYRQQTEFDYLKRVSFIKKKTGDSQQKCWRVWF